VPSSRSSSSTYAASMTVASVSRCGSQHVGRPGARDHDARPLVARVVLLHVARRDGLRPLPRAAGRQPRVADRRRARDVVEPREVQRAVGAEGELLVVRLPARRNGARSPSGRDARRRRRSPACWRSPGLPATPRAPRPGQAGPRGLRRCACTPPPTKPQVRRRRPQQDPQTPTLFRVRTAAKCYEAAASSTVTRRPPRAPARGCRSSRTLPARRRCPRACR